MSLYQIIGTNHHSLIHSYTHVLLYYYTLMQRVCVCVQQDGRKTSYIAQSIKECLSEEFEQDNETAIICMG